MSIASVVEIDGEVYISASMAEYREDEHVAHVYGLYIDAIRESIAALRKVFNDNFLLKEIKLPGCVVVHGINIQFNYMSQDQDLEDIKGLVESVFSFNNMTSGLLVDKQVAIEAHRDLLPNAALVRQEEYAADLLEKHVYEVDELGGKFALIDYEWFTERFSIPWDEFMCCYVHCSDVCTKFYENNKHLIYKAPVSVDTAMIYQELDPHVDVSHRMIAYLTLHLLAGDSVRLLDR